MRTASPLQSALAMAGLLLATGTLAQVPESAANLLAGEIAGSFRRDILLHETNPGKLSRAQDIAGRFLFFQVGQNIGTLDRAGRATLREPRIFERLRAKGHTVANHSHTDPLLIKLDEVKLTEEIDRKKALLAAATDDTGNAAMRGSRAGLFRPPDGARNDLVLAELAARGLPSVRWNIDSRALNKANWSWTNNVGPHLLITKNLNGSLS